MTGPENKTIGGINRRSLLKGAALFGAGLATSGIWLPGKTWAAAAKKGGTLKAGISHGATTDSTVPGTYSHGFAILFSYTAHAKLTVVGPDNKLKAISQKAGKRQTARSNGLSSCVMQNSTMARR